MDLKPPELGKLQWLHTITVLVAAAMSMAAANTSKQFQLSAGFPQNIDQLQKLCLLLLKF